MNRVTSGPATPLEPAPPALTRGRNLWLKREDAHELGAFKWRGALPASAAFQAAGANAVVTASTGNHGAATAWSASRLGLEAAVFVPESASESKLAIVARFGAEIRKVGRDLDEAKEAALAHAEFVGAPFFEDGAERAQYDGYSIDRSRDPGAAARDAGSRRSSPSETGRSSAASAWRSASGARTRSGSASPPQRHPSWRRAGRPATRSPPHRRRRSRTASRFASRSRSPSRFSARWRAGCSSSPSTRSPEPSAPSRAPGSASREPRRRPTRRSSRSSPSTARSCSS